MKRVSPALVTLLMLGVVGFLVMAFLAKKFLWAAPPEPQPIARRNIPTAIVAIPKGTIITNQHLGVAPIQVDQISGQTLVSSRAILGRVAKKDIAPLSQILTGDLFPPGDGPEIEVASGMRAITVQISQQANVVDNLVRPGQFVDVHLHVTDNQSGLQRDRRLRRGLVMTLFEGVKLLAINRSFQPTDPDRGTTTVTFELSEEQANVMLVARDHGDLTLAYTPEGKGTGGVAVADKDRAYLEEVLGLEPLPEEEKPFRAIHYHGTSATDRVFIDGRPASGNSVLRGRRSGYADPYYDTRNQDDDRAVGQRDRDDRDDRGDTGRRAADRGDSRSRAGDRNVRIAPRSMDRG